MKVLLIGIEEVLGDICRVFLEKEYDVVAYKKADYNLLKWDHVINSIGKINPKITFYCQNVEDPYMHLNPQVDLTREVHDGIRNLAQGAARFDSKMVHISSEAVFDGKKPFPQPYFEEDRTAPNTKSGQVKLEGELAVYENSPDFIILRVGWMYHPFGPNFIKELIRKGLMARDGSVKVAINRFGSPTLSYRVAMQIKKLLDADARGVYHVTSEGFCSLAECADFVYKCLDMPVYVEEYEEDETVPHDVLPGNWILENKNLKAESINIMVPWQEDLKAFLERHKGRLLKEVQATL